jgi:acyl-CoA synthetase (AMP-forming)/AMP-acid ligase II/thioesterase domain-containing protein/acyl carrier protein
MSVLRVSPGDTQLTLLGHERGLERTFSYAELLTAAETRAAGLADQGVERGDIVALFAHPTFDFAVGCFAAWRRGAVVVTLPLPPRLGERRAWAGHVNALLRASAAKALMVGEGDPPIDTDVRLIDAASLGNAGRFTDPGPEPSDVALIQFTSGSTSVPKGIVLEHGAVVAALEAIRIRFGLSDESLLSWLPLHHDMGFILYLVRPLCQGVPVVLMQRDTFVQEPLRWIEEMDRTKATLSSTSNSGYGFVARELERYDGKPFDLSHWRFAGCGGEPVDPSTLDRFAIAAARYGFDPTAFGPGWGLAEATCTVTAQSPGSGCRFDWVDRQALSKGEAVPVRSGSAAVPIVDVGFALDGYEVSIVDEGGDQLPDRRVGQIVVRAPSLMRGYLRDEEATKAVLRDGLLHTGDLGYLAGGHLFVTGRIKDVIIVDGANYHAADIERVVGTVSGIRKGGCVAVSTKIGGSEKLAVIAETSSDGDTVQTEKRAIQAAVLAETGISPAVVTLVAPRTLPKTTSGKLKRSEAREMLESGKLVDLGAVASERSAGLLTETEKRVAKIWREVLGVPNVGPADDFFELGGTSLQAARVVIEIESALGVDLPLSVLAERPRLGELAASVDERGRSTSKSLIRLTHSDTRPDVFAVAGAGGTVYGFRTLANELQGACSFYAFEAQGADGRTRPAGSVEEMAAQYIDEMKRIPNGPYILLGYSFGGVVAYEMAAQLSAEGAAPVRVVLLDTAVPPTIQPAGFRSSKTRGIAGIRQSARGLAATRIARSLAWARRNFRTPISPKIYLRYLLGHTNSLSARYTPPAYSGHIDYVRVVTGDHASTERHIQAWRNVAPALRVHAVEIPSHLHLLFEPWVRKLVPVMRGLLEAPAEDRGESEPD